MFMIRTPRRLPLHHFTSLGAQRSHRLNHAAEAEVLSFCLQRGKQGDYIRGEWNACAAMVGYYSALKSRSSPETTTQTGYKNLCSRVAEGLQLV